MRITVNPVRRIEAGLYNRGFTDPVLRAVMLAQVLLVGTAALCGLALVWLSSWPLMFALGAAGMAFNFWFLCRLVFKHFGGVFSRELLVRHLFGFFGRLVLTGLAFGIALVLGGSPVALSAGVLISIGLCALVALLRLRAGRA